MAVAGESGSFRAAAGEGRNDMSLLCAVPLSLLVAARFARRRRVVLVSQLESVSTFNSSLAKRRTHDAQRALEAASELLVK
jgi:hypothetical protein